MIRRPPRSTPTYPLFPSTTLFRSPRPYRAVRRLRHARHRPDAVLPARPEAGRGGEGRPAARWLLVDEHRPGPDGRPDPAADGRAAAGSEPGARLLVRAVGGVHEPSDHRPAGVAAGAGRHDLRGRRAAGGLVRGPAVDFARTRNDAGDGNRTRRLRPLRRPPGRGGLPLPGRQATTSLRTGGRKRYFPSPEAESGMGA